MKHYPLALLFLAPHVTLTATPLKHYGLKEGAVKETGRVLTPKRKEIPVPFWIGETLTYNVAWSSFMTAGELKITVQEKIQTSGTSAYRIVAEGKPNAMVEKLYTLFYRQESLLDAYTLLPLQSIQLSVEGKRRRTRTTIFDHRRKRADYEVKIGAPVKEEREIPADALDALSALYVLRTQPMLPETTLRFSCCESGKCYSVSLPIGPKEMLKTSRGKLQTLRLTPSIRDQHGRPIGSTLTLWVTDDAVRLPVKLAAKIPVGEIVFTLLS
jgi:hypothetical protein